MTTPPLIDKDADAPSLIPTSPLTGGVLATLPLLIWVFAPFVASDDENLEYYNDYTQSHAEYERAFQLLGLEWRWALITMENFETIIDQVVRDSQGYTPVVLNLCDGDELNGVPGVSVIHRLEARGVCYTGADAKFYDLTTSKIVMKQAFDAASVPTPAWEVIASTDDDADAVIERLGVPLIVKPAVSAGSMGITTKSVVHDANALSKEVQQLHDGYRGWNLTSGGVFAESFIKGREFTTFIVGSARAPERRHIYPPVERVFHDKLPIIEQFLSFDRLWEIYERETPVGENEYLWQYAAAPSELADAICEVSWAAYAAVEGTGYGRVDLRFDVATGKLFVLEVNSQCGLSEDENFTSIGAILRFANTSFSEAIAEIIDDALSLRAPMRAPLTPAVT